MKDSMGYRGREKEREREGWGIAKKKESRCHLESHIDIQLRCELALTYQKIDFYPAEDV